jgi:Tfp pilus assembly protein PilO
MMGRRPTTTTKILGAAALLAITGAGWVLVLSPQSSELADVRNQIETTREENATLEQEVAKLEVQRRQLPATRATARALAALFPPTAAQPTLFRAVTAAATTAGIPANDVTELSAAAPVPGSAGGADKAQLPGEATDTDLAGQTVTITVQGDYDEIQRLTENLEDLSRAYLVSSLTLGTGAQPGAYTATVTGQMFVMPAAPDPATAPRR